MGGRELRNILGQNIRTFRSRRNWSQADLAEHAEISINFLGDIERGKKWPHPDTLSKLADALNIGVFELFLDVEMPLNGDARQVMTRFVRDLSLSLNKSLSLSVKQSVENTCEQYALKPLNA